MVIHKHEVTKISCYAKKVTILSYKKDLNLLRQKGLVACHTKKGLNLSCYKRV